MYGGHSGRSAQIAEHPRQTKGGSSRDRSAFRQYDRQCCKHSKRLAIRSAHTLRAQLKGDGYFWPGSMRRKNVWITCDFLHPNSDLGQSFGEVWSHCLGLSGGGWWISGALMYGGAFFEDPSLVSREAHRTTRSHHLLVAILN